MILKLLSALDWIEVLALRNCIWLSSLILIPVSGKCVIVISWSFPKLITDPSDKYKSDHSFVTLPNDELAAVFGSKSL